jgi:ParB family chromosome partitioning protein
MAKTGLGRGLGDILEEIGSTYESQYNEAVENEATGDVVAELSIDSIEPNPYQPRKHFDEAKLRELSESIKHHGLLQPIVVIEHDDRYILIAGERRLRASKLAQFETIKAIIATVELDELRLRELALIENIQREDLNPIELALSYKELLDVHAITHEQLSEIVHKSRSQITNTLRLLSLSSYLQNAIAEGKISQGHAKVLVGLEEEEQKLAADTIIGQKLSVRESEKLIQKLKKSPDDAAKVVEENKFLIDKESTDKYLPNERHNRCQYS